ncbi:hypothetical protein BC628DRAFT_1331207 [Trametes gibbosa]|nr:hypothetical protein BC628DRAFT_1331207 [Trametes gibbosa]
MQFTAVFATLVAFAVSQVSARPHCNYWQAPPNTLDIPGLTNCLDNYRNGNWNGMDCGGRGWFKGTSHYKSPNDCYDACWTCVLEAIDDNASQVECDDYEGDSYCWMGYH